MSTLAPLTFFLVVAALLAVVAQGRHGPVQMGERLAIWWPLVGEGGREGEAEAPKPRVSGVDRGVGLPEGEGRGGGEWGVTILNRKKP